MVKNIGSYTAKVFGLKTEGKEYDPTQVAVAKTIFCLALAFD